MPYAEIGGALLVVTDRGGDGPPVLFWHGQALGAREGAYDHQVEALGDVHRVITARLRDGGDQPAELDEPWGTARVVFGLLDALGIERAVLCGAVDAAEVVVRSALLQPDRVRGLVLLHVDLPAPVVAGSGTDRSLASEDHLADRFDELAMPVLIVHGDADQDRPADHARALAEVVSDPRGVVVVAGGSGDLAATHSEVVTTAIRDYLEDLPA